MQLRIHVIIEHMNKENKKNDESERRKQRKKGKKIGMNEVTISSHVEHNNKEKKE